MPGHANNSPRFRCAAISVCAWVGMGLVSAVAVGAFAPRAAGQQAAGASSSSSKRSTGLAARRPLESVRLRDGRVLRGLVLAERQGAIELAEIVEPRGRPMYAVVRPIGREQIVSIDQLRGKPRADLEKLVESLRRRAVIEAGRIDNVKLERAKQGRRSVNRYRGPWFELESTADASTTRLSVVKLEQIFRALRHALPPRAAPNSQLRVLLLGSREEYAAELARYNLGVEHPAAFLPAENRMIVRAGVAQAAAPLVAANREIARQLVRYDRLNEESSDKLTALADDLRRAGYSRAEVASELAARRRAWRRHQAVARSRLLAARRRNEAAFHRLTQEYYQLLSHEAFHAYVENYLFPRAENPVPAWLNEGLAQVFSTGLVEGGRLRIGAVHAPSLKRLRAEIKEGKWLPLADLLAADGQEFLTLHGRAKRESQRSYAYAWGLAYYLVIGEPALTTGKLAAYVKGGRSDNSARRRFESLVGLPLAEFDRRWRAFLAQLAAEGP